MSYNNQSALVIGAGISGFAAAKYLASAGACVTLSDAKDEADAEKDPLTQQHIEDLRTQGISCVFGAQREELLEGTDLIVLSPAVPERIPLVQAARARGIRVTTEVELAGEIARAPIYAITGTNGKTTTTTLLGELLRAHFPAVGVGGNIGVPLIDVAQETPADGAIAAEISSYQMEATAHFHAAIVAELNVTPDHIVRHGSMEVYQAMKEKLFAAQTAEDVLVLNYDDPHTRSMADRAKGRVCFFSRREELAEGAVVRADGMIVIRWNDEEHVLIRTDELGIPGGHNVENALAAAAMAFFAGVTPAEMRPVLRAFKGVEHRIEFVRTLDNVSYYNDSKATNTDSAIKALEAFDGHIILIAGGDDKLTDLTEFMALVCARVDELILVGDAAERFAAAALDAGIAAEHIHRAGYHMVEAVRIAHELAAAGQTVLLSPACASFDMYGGYEERGRDFKRIVNEL
ncbi:UDP-N-acetylmuramoyl-L-alanine--D-glutamate ligase [Selenomonas sp. oral taxon 892 str. F0426]|uniref:UDP-N-acetylmuramoyl-L-alanine--D-glutamate ligase n=1 Tax=Selenomonas sp. oral taxon 892 TaxID=1321785 RepID=UPI0003AD0241|nr:UDP-N-acetylmuramoyl-L-alanine--D-glutamate ligase [Selenomonas sp. oral taxon 892]ERJ95391.1 UDP-N-acetylmuramoyl-L-alanine--D-glutamate ligase [Selenomonas sp. oral taxon 892 str. F0426]